MTQSNPKEAGRTQDDKALICFSFTSRMIDDNSGGNRFGHSGGEVAEEAHAAAFARTEVMQMAPIKRKRATEN